MNGEINKGKVLSIDGRRAKVAPIDNIDLVSRELTIPDYIEGDTIHKDDDVVFCVFPDLSGVILSKM